MIRGVAVEPLFDNALRQSQYLSPCSVPDGLKIYAFGNPRAEQFIQFNGDVASQLSGDQVFFKPSPVFPPPSRASQIFSFTSTRSLMRQRNR